MSQWLRAHIVLPEDTSSILSTYVRLLAITCNSNSRESDAFGLSRHLFVHTHTHTHTPKTKMIETHF